MEYGHGRSAAVVAWTFTEYMVHRCLFHLSPITPARHRQQFVMSGTMVERGRQPRRLTMAG